MIGCRLRRLICVGFASLVALPFGAWAQQEARTEPQRQTPAATAVPEQPTEWLASHHSRGTVVVLAQQTRQKNPSPFENVPDTSQQPQQQEPSQQAQPAPGQQAQPQGQQQGQQPPSPFEEVPEANPANPQQEPPSPFSEVTEEQKRKVGDFIEAVEFRGARRIPRDSLMARIFSKPGDTYDQTALLRDFMVLVEHRLFR